MSANPATLSARSNGDRAEAPARREARPALEMRGDAMAAIYEDGRRVPITASPQPATK